MNTSIKRILDVTFALLGLILGAPLIAVIVLLVRLDSPGRAIFSQPRLGLRGRVFRMHKFRKFPDNWGTKGASVTVIADARMTRIGGFLERTKLDELPQLWNILIGEMSFVGPRPETLNFEDLFVGEFAGVHDYVPGIFGPNQVAFRNEARLYPPDQDPETFYREQLFPSKARNDLDYFSRATVWTDLLWILRGLWSSIAGTVDWRRLARHRGKVLITDLCLVELAWLCANLFRFEGLPNDVYWDVYLTGTWLVPAVVISAVALGGGYRGLLSHFCSSDALRLASTLFMGWGLAYLLLIVWEHRNASIGAGLMAALLTLAMIGAERILHRERSRRLTDPHGAPDTTAAGKPLVCAIYGTGRRGIALAGLLRHGFTHVSVAGFLDDNPSDLAGRQIAGYRSLGSERDLDTVHAVYRLDQLWMTFEPDRYKHQRLRDWCDDNQVDLIVLPLIPPFLALSATVAVQLATGSAQPSGVPNTDPLPEYALRQSESLLLS